MRGSHAAIALALCALGAPAASAANATATAALCPEGYSADPARSDAILARLAAIDPRCPPVARDRGAMSSTTAASPSTRDLAKQMKATSMCFGVTDVSVVSLDGMLLVNSRADDRALAARVAHLAMHLADPSRFDPAKRVERDCARWVDSVLQAEAQAYAMELEVARELGVATAYEFAADVERVVSSERSEDIIAAFLRAHPNGSSGIEPLASSYAERCAASVQDK